MRSLTGKQEDDGYASYPVTVDCNGCTACCQGSGVFLDMRHDKVEDFHAPLTWNDHVGEMRPMIPKQDNGDCYYLDRATGCTIYDHRPTPCQLFDCRLFARTLLSTPRNVRRRVLRERPIDHAIFNAGRARMG